MPDLNELSKLIPAARAQSDLAAQDSAREEQRLRALRQQASDFRRRFDNHNEVHHKQQEELERSIAQSEERAAGLRAKKQAALAELVRAYGQLEPISDPRVALPAFDANYPILLFPVRLETRFVTVNAEERMTKQLLVRVYPDDCQVDGFEPDLSENEVKDLRRYWCSMWQAGGDEGLESSAWRDLCAGYGAGRAMYLVRQYLPLAGSDPLPVRASVSRMILVVPLDAPLASAAEKNAIAEFWTAVWRAGYDQIALTAAFNVLRTKLTAARADEVRSSLAPFNIKDQPQPGVDRATVPASTVFVVLTPASAAAVKRQAWTRSPQAALLPDRFVLIADSGPEHIELLGGMIQQPLAVGPDPLAVPTEQFSSADGELLVPKPLQWMTDFETALKAGMAFRIDLTPRQADLGFNRLYVVGVRLTSNQDQGRLGLEQLIQHQANSQSGFSVLPQGTPTNNSEEGSSGWSRIQEADDLFNVTRLAQSGQEQFDPTATAPYAKRDGLALAEALGIDAAVLQEIPNTDGTDQAEGRAMNTALWPATLGYWMNTQMQPVFDASTIALARRHFIERVTGRGAVPALRIGKQPYGILPTTAWSRMNWMEGGDDRINGSHRRFLQKLRDLLRQLQSSYWDKLAADAPRVGKPATNPQQRLLDIVGLHPASVEFHLGVVDSADRIWNGHQFYARGLARLKSEMTAQMAAGLSLLKDLGFKGPAPEIISKFFSYVHGPMTRPVIDDLPLSETDELAPCTDDGKNYLEWCRDKAQAAFEDLRLQNGFSAGKTPNALLYHVLRHALQLGYYDVAVGLHQDNGLLSTAQVAAAYHEPAFVHVAGSTTAAVSESRYRLLYAKQSLITGAGNKTVAEFIPAWLTASGHTSNLADQVQALDVLAHAHTASLERAFAEHIDLCSYRWDAWMLSLVNERLHQMRRPGGDQNDRRQGLYLGAFGWVEDLKPDPAAPPVAQISDDARKIFMKPGQPPLQRDPENAGHVLAPSLNHAVTAAVLRNGYLNNATPATPDLLAVDISSSRVRVALQFIEGIRNGQPLGALLGYQFERRLHDRHDDAETDRFIYQVRKAFPLAAKRMADTVEGDAKDTAIENIEARNVCDGLLLLEHVRTNPIKTYPWSKDLDPANPAQQAIIDEEVAALFEIQDAIADVAMAESVHQVTTGNIDRAAAAMDAAGKSAFPPEPDVVTTPRSGVSMTHRVGLHLKANAVAGAGANPRAQVAPAIDHWLGTVLPPLNQIVAHVTSKNTPPGSAASDTDVSMQDLGLNPIDLLHLLDTSSDQAMNELDDRIVDHIITTKGLCPDASVIIQYTVRVPGVKTVFEVAPLIGSLRNLVLNARWLKPSDAALQNEATSTADATLTVPAALINAARASVVNLRTDADTFRTTLDPLILPAALFPPIVAAVDAAADDFVALQHEAGLCGVALAGAGPVLKARREWFELVRANAAKVLDRWQTKLAQCDALLAQATNPANSDVMKIDALEKAEREISTDYTTPILATPAPLLAIVNTKRGIFAAAIAKVEAVTKSAATTVNALWTAWNATFAGRDKIDLTVDTTDSEAAQLRTMLHSMHQQVSGMIEELGKRLEKGDGLIADAATAGGERKALMQVDAAKAFLGDGMRIVPRFTLPVEQGNEWQNAFDARAALIAHLSPAHDFPVDDWLYGIARVRTKMHDLENVIQLADAFETSEPTLAPVQFPFRPGEPWLAMELPTGFDMTTAGDHLLYTARYVDDVFDKNAPSFAGLLLDEWTEVVPGTRETAGLAFNYDRPNNEPPQSLLLVTPATSGPNWAWEDLRAAIPETFALARTRAVEPRDIAKTALARFLPATLMAFTTQSISISSEIRVADVAVANVAAHHV
jgi:hypothetical protein